MTTTTTTATSMWPRLQQQLGNGRPQKVPCEKKKERTAHEFSQPVWWCRALRSHVDPLRRRLVLTTLGAIISGFGLVCCVQCTRVCVCVCAVKEKGR
ncbi:hypothetical protein DAI22_11g187500 [Oryza sativa Japonica Group]|nr:hypothetical protein DAI22_11g187500 [Oryza sativa Japonica Group]